MKAVMRLLGVLVFPAGIALVLWAAVMVSDTRTFLDGARSVPGTVVGLHFASSPSSAYLQTYRPVVRYSVEGRDYTIAGTVGSYPPAYRKGDQVTVSYRADHPEQGRLNSKLNLWFLPAVLAGIGAVLIVATFVVLMRSRRRARNRQLRGDGSRIAATVTQVVRETTIEVNGAHPFRIEAQWQDPSTGQNRLFKSPRVWLDPTDDLPANRQVWVFIDPFDPKRYLMDISFLPEGELPAEDS